MTFMYSQAQGELDVYLKARARVIWDVMAIFAQHILNLRKLDPPPKDRGVYRLEQFKRRGIPYRYGADSGIISIGVRRIRLTPKFGSKRHIIVEGNPGGASEPVYDTLEKDLSPLRLDDMDVTQVELKVVFGRMAFRKKRTLPVTITVPNRCSLGYDELELTVRKMLIVSGIEPKNPPAGESDGG
jgi:hypothetical protein